MNFASAFRTKIAHRCRTTRQENRKKTEKNKAIHAEREIYKVRESARAYSESETND